MKFTNIQVIRFAAATSVLLMHLGFYSQSRLGVHGPVVEALATPAFGMGVVAFFAVSGFVLAHSIQTTSVPRFLGLRAARIYPPFWAASALVLTVRLLAGYGRPDVGDWNLFHGYCWRALLLVPPGSPRMYYVLGVEWTLVYEVFFYAALGLLAFAGRRRGIPIAAGVWLGLCLVRMAVAPAKDGMMFPSWRGIIFSPMIPPFLCGVLAYYGRRWADCFRLWMPLAGACLIAVGYASGYTARRPDLYGVLAGSGFALLVLWSSAGAQLSADNSLVRFGDYSYGVYLVHVPILLLLFTVGGDLGWVPRSLAGVIAVGLTTLLLGLAYGRAETACYAKLRRWLLPAKRRVPEPVTFAARAA